MGLFPLGRGRHNHPWWMGRLYCLWVQYVRLHGCPCTATDTPTNSSIKMPRMGITHPGHFHALESNSFGDIAGPRSNGPRAMIHSANGQVVEEVVASSSLHLIFLVDGLCRFLHSASSLSLSLGMAPPIFSHRSSSHGDMIRRIRSISLSFTGTYGFGDIGITHVHQYK